MDNTKYFHRTISFTRKNEQISLIDLHKIDNITPLDEWLGIVVTLADGDHTVQELVDYMAQRYQNPPENLEKTIHSAIERLEEGKIIQLTEQAVELPYYLASPLEDLDLEKARALMLEDAQKMLKNAGL
jgi:hypothetical protein